MSLTKVSFSMITGAPISIKDFGAVGDGVADDTAAFVAAASAMQDNTTLYLPSGTYLISATNAVTHQSGAAYGKVAMALTSLQNVLIEGDDAVIKVVNHNCSSGGLTFVNFKACQRFAVRGIKFEMTFTGVNTSASLYPFCGAITAIDDVAAGQTQSQICGDALIERCSFNLYHPFGSYAQSGAPFSGDPNNGYKVYSVFTSGPYLATDYDEQCRNIIVRDCVFKDGHNAYGIWVWSWNNILIEGNTAEAWVSKYSLANGTFGGTGIPMVRYMQFHCSGIKVANNSFKAKPCDQRTGAYSGAAIFCSLNGQLTGDYSHGESVMCNNTIILGNGDAANTQFDYGITVSTFGSVTISNNSFDGISTATNAYSSSSIYYRPEIDNQNNGIGSLSITGNTFGANLSYDTANISIANGSNVSDYDRRAKAIVVSNNVSLSQLQYFIDMTASSSATYLGCRSTIISDNVIVGTFNTVFNSANTNSRAMRLAGNVANDQLSVTNNVIRDKYYATTGSDVSASANVLFDNNRLFGVTEPFLSAPASLWQSLTNNQTFVPVVTGSAVAGTGTYTLQEGKYYRIGNLIHYQINITLTAHTGSGQMRVSLPTKSKISGGVTSGWVGAVLYQNLAAGLDKQVTFNVAPNSLNGLFFAMDSNDGAYSVLNIDGACTFSLTGWYEADQ